MSAAPIRLLIADDSAAIRELLRRLVSGHPRLCIVGEAEDGAMAVEMALELEPDVITMDIVMPRLDGISATAAIMARAPTRIVVVCDTSQPRHTDMSFRAIEAGALELIPKAAGREPIGVWARRLLESLCLMAEIPVVKRRRMASVRDRELAAATGSISVFGIAASTGGPPALARILGELPRDFPAPILIAQHLSPGFGRGFCRWLASLTRLSVREAEHGEQPRPGAVYLAPDGSDLWVAENGRMAIGAALGPHNPSADRLLASLSQQFGSRAGGIVLTGMGDDGAAGLQAIRRAGGMTIAQDAASSIVFGMPRAAAERDAARQILPLSGIAEAMLQLAAVPSRTRAGSFAR